MDVFFVVTTAVVFLAGVLLLVGLFYLVRILKSVDHIIKNVSEESDSVREDVSLLRAKARDEGVRITHLMDFFLGRSERKAAKKAKKSQTGN